MRRFVWSFALAQPLTTYRSFSLGSRGAPATSFSRISLVKPVRRLNHRLLTTMSSSDASKFKIALCQMAVTSSKDQNLDQARSILRDAASKGAKLAVLPECFQTPYSTASFREYSEQLPEAPCDHSGESPSLEMLRKMAIETGMYIVGGSVPEITPSDDKLYNTSMTVSPDGTMIAKHRKVHLFDIDVPGGITFRESDVLSAGNRHTAFRAAELNANFGVGICYDVRFPELSMIETRNMNADILLFPGAFNMTTGPAHWELLLRSRALDNQVYVAACSPARATEGDGYKAWGHSMVVDPWGTVLDTLDEKPGLLVVEVNLEKIREVRSAIPTGSQRRTDMYTLTKKD